MSFTRSKIGFAYDPCNITHLGTNQTFDFSQANTANPGYQLLEDSFPEAVVQLADGTSRMYVMGAAKALRNVQLNVGMLDRLGLLKYRLYREGGRPVALFPNYNADTCVLSHFESSLVGEVGITAVYQDVSSTTQSASYTNGVIGAGLVYDWCATRPRRLKYDATFTSSAFTVSSWWKSPADWTSGSVLALFSATASTHGNLFGAYLNGTTMEFDWSSGGGSVTSSVGSIAASTWYHWCVAASGSDVTIYWNGAALNASHSYVAPTMAAPFYLGYYLNGAGTCRASGFDEFRWDVAAMTATQVGALYDRGHEADELMLAEQTQGHYFYIPADPMGLISYAAASRATGTMLCRGMWYLDSQRVSLASYA